MGPVQVSAVVTSCSEADANGVSALKLDNQWEHFHSRKAEVAQPDVSFRVKQKVLSVECRRSASAVNPEHDRFHIPRRKVVDAP